MLITSGVATIEQHGCGADDIGGSHAVGAVSRPRHCDNSDYFTVEYRQAVSPAGIDTLDFGAGALRGKSAVNGAVVMYLHTPVPSPSGGNSFPASTNLNAGSLVVLPNNGALAPALGSAAH